MTRNQPVWGRLVVLLAPLILGGLLPAIALAQADSAPEPTPPPQAIPQIHAVAEGENLTTIAQTYGVTVDELLLVNNLQPDAILQIGQELIIPGGEGEAVPTVYQAQLGDSLAGVAAAFNTTLDELLAASRLINPYYQLPVGQALPIVSLTGTADPQTPTGTPILAAEGDSLLALAARHNLTPAALAAANDLPRYGYLFPEQRLRLPGDEPYRFLPGDWAEIRLRPLPVTQGGTVALYVENLHDGQPTGEFVGQQLRFAPYEDGFVALVGIDAFTEPGAHPLVLGGMGERPWTPFRQDVNVAAVDYGTQYINVEAELSDLLDMELRREEDALLRSIFAQFSEEPRWDGLFQTPVSPTVVTAGYGAGRSYNDGPIQIYHTGVDFAGGVGTPIVAPAAGVVVFNDELQVRGRTVILNHGLGVMTGYYHLSDTFVAVGDSVTAGQPIAAGGSTGLSTGPHLHWDLRIMNVPVNGMIWTQEPFP